MALLAELDVLLPRARLNVLEFSLAMRTDHEDFLRFLFRAISLRPVARPETRELAIRMAEASSCPSLRRAFAMRAAFRDCDKLNRRLCFLR